MSVRMSSHVVAENNRLTEYNLFLFERDLIRPAALEA